MALADRFISNKLLSVTELDTFLRGSKHAPFGEWLRDVGHGFLRADATALGEAVVVDARAPSATAAR